MSISYEKLINEISKEIPNELIKSEYSSYDLLSLSVHFIDVFLFDTSTKLIKLADKINIINDDFYNLFRHSVMQNKACWRVKYNNEYYLYEPIKHFIGELIENAEIIEHEIINRKRPDIFLTVNNDFCVGEVKTDNFTNTHINQLRMYIETYQTRIGYAFGKKLTGKLDDNMIFINIEGLKDRFYIDL